MLLRSEKDAAAELTSYLASPVREFFKLIENNKEFMDKAIIKADSYYVPIDRYIV